MRLEKDSDLALTIDELEKWMKGDEDEHLEFKEAKESFEFEKLVKYCVALANECGGKMILGVTNKKPRKVVGTAAFESLERTKNGLFEQLHLRIEANPIVHPDGRVLVFEVPSRPTGHPIEYRGSYLMRAGESLVAMSPDQIKKILDEATPDFSAEICPRATTDDLATEGIVRFRKMWKTAAKNPALERYSDFQVLRDTDLVTDDGVTYAALILMGKKRSLDRLVGQAEVIFEYRSKETSTSFQQREEYREGFLLFLDDLWERINLRNDLYHYVDGLFDINIPTFQDDVVREALLNAVSHRDYRLSGSVFVKQFSKRLDIISPGPFPTGVNAENILTAQNPRNRLIAENLQRCGLIQRSGQGADRMFEEMIKAGKRSPDFSKSDEHQVFLSLHGEVQDPRFLRFLQRIGEETLSLFDALDLFALDLIHRDETLPDQARERVPKLLDSGVIERFGRGKGRHFIVSKRFYEFLGEKGAYTRKRGLDDQTNMELLLKHLRDNKAHGSPLDELHQVLPSLSRRQVQGLLRKLMREGRAFFTGRTRAARWYPSS